MNEALTLHKEFCPPGLDNAITLLGLSRRKSDELSKSARDVVVSVQQIVDELTGVAIQKQTAAEFKEVRDQIFPTYFRLMCSISDVARHSMPLESVERVMSEACSEIEADFRDPASLARFGETIREQAAFTAWMLRKTSSLLMTILAHPDVPEEAKEKDKQLGTDFTLHSAWSQFHLDCLQTAIHRDTSIYPEVGEEIVDGLRAAVNSYSFARQGVDLRLPPQEPQLQPYESDDEDQELIDSSMSELDRKRA